MRLLALQMLMLQFLSLVFASSFVLFYRLAYHISQQVSEFPQPNSEDEAINFADLFAQCVQSSQILVACLLVHSFLAIYWNVFWQIAKRLLRIPSVEPKAKFYIGPKFLFSVQFLFFHFSNICCKNLANSSIFLSSSPAIKIFVVSSIKHFQIFFSA